MDNQDIVTTLSAQTEVAVRQEDKQDSVPDLGKFKDVLALKTAYENLEAEFTRRSQQLKDLLTKQAKGTPVEKTASGPKPSVSRKMLTARQQAEADNAVAPSATQPTVEADICPNEQRFEAEISPQTAGGSVQADDTVQVGEPTQADDTVQVSEPTQAGEHVQATGNAQTPASAEQEQEDRQRFVTTAVNDEEVKKEVIKNYLLGVRGGKSVPLMTGGVQTVTEKKTLSSVKEASRLAKVFLTR